MIKYVYHFIFHWFFLFPLQKFVYALVVTSTGLYTINIIFWCYQMCFYNLSFTYTQDILYLDKGWKIKCRLYMYLLYKRSPKIPNYKDFYFIILLEKCRHEGIVLLSITIIEIFFVLGKCQNIIFCFLVFLLWYDS